jgi:hypothetical protein
VLHVSPKQLHVLVSICTYTLLPSTVAAVCLS